MFDGRFWIIYWLFLFVNMKVISWFWLFIILIWVFVIGVFVEVLMIWFVIVFKIGEGCVKEKFFLMIWLGVNLICLVIELYLGVDIVIDNKFWGNFLIIYWLFWFVNLNVIGILKVLNILISVLIIGNFVLVFIIFFFNFVGFFNKEKFIIFIWFGIRVMFCVCVLKFILSVIIW